MIPMTPLLDADNDGLTNKEEFDQNTNPRKSDTDDDGMWDGWETTYGLDPNIDDANDNSDSDSLTNVQEYIYHTDPTRADTDGDGINDDVEISSGTDPLAWSSSLVAEVSELTMSPGSSRTITLLLENTSRESDRFALSVAGVEPGWLEFESGELRLLAGEEKEIPLHINIPEDCGISEPEYTISVSAASPDTGMVANGGAAILLHVENALVMADLVPEDGISLGTNGVAFSWRTDAVADSTLYYRAAGETEFLGCCRGIRYGS